MGIMSTSNVDVFGVRFTGKNYSTWEFQFRIFVMGKELGGHIDCSDLAPTEPIEVDCHSIQKALNPHIISLPYVSTTLQIADVFTKAMTRQRHQFLVGKLMLLD